MHKDLIKKHSILPDIKCLDSEGNTKFYKSRVTKHQDKQSSKNDNDTGRRITNIKIWSKTRKNI